MLTILFHDRLVRNFWSMVDYLLIYSKYLAVLEAANTAESSMEASLFTSHLFPVA